MSESETLAINIDGASRGNPGPAAFAYVIRRHGHPVIEEAACLPPTTNNSAEYTALVRALEHAATLGSDRVLIRSDSELLVKQMNGQYRVKNPDLQVLYAQAKKLSQRFREVKIVHVRREDNVRADELCNLALDGDRRTRSASSSTGAQRIAMETQSREKATKEEALACLRAAAHAWSLGNPEVPSPDLVLEQIWSVLDENGLFKSRRSR
jgi:ribonuclease HI